MIHPRGGRHKLFLPGESVILCRSNAWIAGIVLARVLEERRGKAHKVIRGQDPTGRNGPSASLG